MRSLISTWIGKQATWLRHLTTGKDNTTPDVVRILGLLIGVQFILNAGWAIVVQNAPFDPTNYGTGAAALLAAIGAALGLKAKCEPE